MVFYKIIASHVQSPIHSQDIRFVSGRSLRLRATYVDCVVMSMRVLSRQFQALAQSSIRSANQTYEKSAERLATGKRINSASDNAAASAISLKMTAEIKTSEQAFRNLNDSISLLQTFEGSARSIVDIMGRMRQLAVASGNQTLSTHDSINLASEELGN